MHILRNKSLYFTLVLSALLLCLSLISSMISNIIPFLLGSSFLKIDLSLSFLCLSFIICGWKYGLSILLANFIIHPLLPGTNIGFIELFLIGKIIFAITCLIFVSLFSLFLKLYNKTNILMPLAMSTVISTIIMTILNGVLFTPIFMNIISNGFYNLNFIILMEQYNDYNLNTLFIMPNYWGGMVLVYSTFNLTCLSINSFIVYKLSRNLKIFF